MRRRIEVVIDEVVWHDGDASQRDTFGTALQRALTRELASPQLQAALGRGDARIQSLDAGRVPRVAGDTVARAVAGSITRARGPKS